MKDGYISAWCASLACGRTQKEPKTNNASCFTQSTLDIARRDRLRTVDLGCAGC